jgi:hypothetical protein
VDTNPHYIESGGDYLWKEPDQGQNIAKIVDVIGDGNNRPFAGQSGNELYVQFILAITLKNGQNAGEARMKVTMPMIDEANNLGYGCTVRGNY